MTWVVSLHTFLHSDHMKIIICQSPLLSLLTSLSSCEGLTGFSSGLDLSKASKKHCCLQHNVIYGFIIMFYYRIYGGHLPHFKHWHSVQIHAGWQHLSDLQHQQQSRSAAWPLTLILQQQVFHKLQYSEWHMTQLIGLLPSDVPSLWPCTTPCCCRRNKWWQTSSWLRNKTILPNKHETNVLMWTQSTMTPVCAVFTS